MEHYGVFTIDKTNLFSEELPYVVVRTNDDKEVTEPEWLEYEEAFRRLYAEAGARNHRFSIIFRLTLSKVPPAYIRRKGKLMIELLDETERCLVSSAIIVENFLVRKTISALFGVVYRVVRPQKFCENMEEAFEFVAQQNAADWSEQRAKAFLAARKQRG